MTKQDKLFELQNNNENIDNLINQVKTLDGQIFALLSPSEFDLFYFFCKTGKKYGVTTGVELINGEFCSDQLSFVKNSESYHKIFSTNATVKVMQTNCL